MKLAPPNTRHVTEFFLADYRLLNDETRLKVYDAMEAIAFNLDGHGWDVKPQNGDVSGDFSVKISQNLRLHFTKKLGIVTFLRIIEDFEDIA